MNIDQAMKELKSMGSKSVKKIQKKVKKNNQLSLELYKTGNVDAMYLARLIANEKQIPKKDPQTW
ncbi:hypothetical protein LEP1GSC051_1357 [Leptospira sp. P2653]|nr:hypothetical protein LEP1GSC051_1357 [Leptospira sp. P2653]